MLELLTAALITGAVAYHTLSLSLSIIALVACSIALWCAVAWRTARGLLLALSLGCALLLGAITMWSTERQVPEALFGNRAFEGAVSTVDRRLSHTTLTIEDTVYHERLQLFVYEETAALPGDIISVRGEIEKPESFLTDQGRLFDYPSYLAAKGIQGVGYRPAVLIIDEGRFSLERLATKIRFAIGAILARFVSFPVDGIIAGMTVGSQGALPDDVEELFRTTGVLHVLVLSGYNIMLLAGFLAIVLRALPFRVRTAFSIAAIVLLVLISGSGAASIRAGIMGSIAILSGVAVRTYRPLRALSIALLAFFFVSPLSVFSDPGLHLSFIATASMLFVVPKVSALFRFIPQTRGVDVRELFTLAVVMPLMTLPYIMYFSGMFPWSAPLANILLALATPILMAGGIVLLALSWVAPLAQLLGILLSALGESVLSILTVLSRIPLWQMLEIPWWTVVLCYGVIVAALFWRAIFATARQLQNALAPSASSSD